MGLVEKTLVSLTILFVCYALQDEVDLTQERSKIYIRGVFCNSSEKFYYKNFTCFAKSLNRTFSGINLIATTKYPLYNITIFGTLFYKYGNIYREVLHTPHIKLCDILEIMESDHPMIKYFIEAYKDLPPELKTRCPITSVTVRNLPIKFNRFAGITPSGDYKFIHSTTVLGELAATMIIYSTCNSSNKNSYG